MRAPCWLIIALLLISLSLSVSAREGIPGKVTGLATAVPLDKTSATERIVPLPVRPLSNQSFLDISSVERSTESVLDRERASYQSIRLRLQNAPAAEQSSLRDDLSLQRQAVLMAILNRVTIIYQRIDLIIEKSDASLTKLSALHDQNPRTSDFSARMQVLRSRLAALKARSDKVASELESCPKSVDLSACVKSARDDASVLLAEVVDYLSLYRGLATQVLSR